VKSFVQTQTVVKTPIVI